MKLTKQQLKQLIQEEMRRMSEGRFSDEDIGRLESGIDDDHFSQERYARAGFPEGGPEGDPLDEPGAWVRAGKEPVEGEDYIIYKGMRYELPADPEERAAVEAFIDAFLDPERG